MSILYWLSVTPFSLSVPIFVGSIRPQSATDQASSGAANRPAQSTPSTEAEAAPFGMPRRIEAGGKFLGTKRLYPSPVVRDMNGDGLADLVVGDLWGKITIALRVAGKGPLAFEADTEMKAADGKAIDFHNW
ncbi:MAG: hypothetical protein JNJ88_01035 [Planctomycetes bacterium]|nr:hypothetical protein [Planctomycetota bacterium]